uniref:Prepilin-type N-terminal cleavage/methylation domain-containing protein n=1 Tax=Cyanothece sp. (strain PCC 7425 / ATCC 29141) TaxID=395961 RepID=B8HQ01_CYAP4
MIKHLPSSIPANRSRSSSRGFALPEVLVSIILVAIYAGLGFQALLVSTLFKMRAERDTRIANWMESDMAVLRYQAGTLQSMLAKQGTASPINTAADLLGDTRCRPDLNNGVLGFANALQNANSSGSNTTTLNIGNRNYSIVKTYNISPDRPQVLRVTYVATDTTNQTEISRITTEVTPDIVTLCNAGTN